MRSITESKYNRSIPANCSEMNEAIEQKKKMQWQETCIRERKENDHQMIMIKRDCLDTGTPYREKH